MAGSNGPPPLNGMLQTSRPRPRVWTQRGSASARASVPAPACEQRGARPRNRRWWLEGEQIIDLRVGVRGGGGAASAPAARSRSLARPGCRGGAPTDTHAMLHAGRPPSAALPPPLPSAAGDATRRVAERQCQRLLPARPLLRRPAEGPRAPPLRPRSTAPAAQRQRRGRPGACWAAAPAQQRSRSCTRQTRRPRGRGGTGPTCGAARTPAPAGATASRMPARPSSVRPRPARGAHAAGARRRAPSRPASVPAATAR